MNKNNGFNLIELLVVVGIIGVIAAIGLVGYNGYLTSAGQKIAAYETSRMNNDTQEAAINSCISDCIGIASQN